MFSAAEVLLGGNPLGVLTPRVSGAEEGLQDRSERINPAIRLGLEPNMPINTD